MDSKELVSVIITTYKRPVEILSRAVESVLTQSWKDLELILVNDWPEDPALAARIRSMVEALGDGRVRLIEHARNLGSNAARNTGLAAAKGEYVAFLDDDDTWTPEKLARQLEAFRRFPEAAMVYGSFDNEERDGSVRRVRARPGPLPLERLLQSNVIGPTSFPLMKTAVLRELGSFDPEQKSSQDFELWLRFLTSFPVVGIEDCVGRRYYSADSVFHRSNERFYAGDRRILDKYRDSYRAYPRVHSNHLLNMFLYALRSRDYGVALRYKLDAWRAEPGNPNNLLPVLLYGKLRARGADKRGD